MRAHARGFSRCLSTCPRELCRSWGGGLRSAETDGALKGLPLLWGAVTLLPNLHSSASSLRDCRSPAPMLRRGRTNPMWNNTRLVVFAAICASLYAAILIPFKVLPIIPGVTELRPANAVPVICSFLFGPAAGWGAAIGNIIGDFFGGLGPGDFFGFIGNFLYGMAPYKIW